MAVEGRQPATTEFRMRAKDGAYYWLDCRYTPIRDAAGRLLEIEGLLADITERKKAAEKLASSPRPTRLLGSPTARSSSTGCAKPSPRPSVARLHSRFSTSISTGSRTSMTRWDILPAICCSSRSVSASRAASARPTSSRVWAATSLPSCKQIWTMSPMPACWRRRFTMPLSAPYPLGDTEMRITVSIGISPWMSETAGPDDMLAQADIALYRAKDDGRNRYCFHYR